jgi:hypothetical protein
MQPPMPSNHARQEQEAAQEWLTCRSSERINRGSSRPDRHSQDLHYPMHMSPCSCHKHLLLVKESRHLSLPPSPPAGSSRRRSKRLPCG